MTWSEVLRLDQSSPGIAMAAAGVAGVAAAALEWNTVTREGVTDVLRGTDTSAGMGTFAFGFVLLVVASFLLLRGRRTGGRGASITGLVVAAAVLIVGVYSVVSPGAALAWLESQYIAETYGLPEKQVENVLLDAIDRGELEVAAGPGAWAGAASGLTGVIAGVAGARRSRRIRERNAVLTAALPLAESGKTLPRS